MLLCQLSNYLQNPIKPKQQLSRWFLNVFEYATKPSLFGHVGLPLFMGFFGILYLLWGIVTAVFVFTKPQQYDEILDLGWQDDVHWIFEILLILSELCAIYFIFEIIFLKPLNIESDLLDPAHYFPILHMYNGMLVCTFSNTNKKRKV